MTLLALPLGHMAHAWQKLMIVNPPAGLAVAAAALIGYAIYEEVQSSKKR